MFHNVERVRRTLQGIAVATIVTVYSSAICFGQAPYTIGVTADVTGGAKSPNNFGGSSLSQNSGDIDPFVGTYPSISFKAKGEHSSLESRYGFGYDRNFTDPRSENRSHAASLGYSAGFGPNWKFNLSDSFSMTSDISSYNLLSGSSAETAQSAQSAQNVQNAQGAQSAQPDQFQFAFNPVFAQSNRSNTASVSLDRILNPKSVLAFSSTYSTLVYPSSSFQAAGVVSDQQRLGTGVRYTHSGQRSGWSIGYTGTVIKFATYEDSSNHTVLVGYTHRFSPALSVQLDAGPSYVSSSEDLESTLGTNVTIAIIRVIAKGSLNFRVSQRSGDTSGLGSVSTFQEVGLNYSRTFGKSTTISADVSGFNSEELKIDPLSSRGYAAGGNIAFSMGRNWSMNFGGQFQHYEGSDIFPYDQKRIFASLRYSNPELWRF